MTQAPHELPDAQPQSSAPTTPSAHAQLRSLSREVRRRWHELDDKLDGLDARLHQSGEAHADTTLQSAFTRVSELSEVVKDLVHSAAVKAEESLYPVRSLLTGPAVTCAPSDTLAQAAKLLWERDCGALIVTDAEARPLGVLTDRDICMAAYTRGLPLHAMDVTSCMSREVHAISASSSIRELCGLLAQHRVRRAPVVENGKLVGVAALADLVRLAQSSQAALLPLSVLVTQTLGRICESDVRSIPGPGASSGAFT